MNAIDTNVVAYSVDADAGEKRLRALTLLDELDPAETVIPWQVVCEAGSVLLKLVAKGRSQADPTALVRALTNRFRVAMPTEGLILEGLRLRTDHQMSIGIPCSSPPASKRVSPASTPRTSRADP